MKLKIELKPSDGVDVQTGDTGTRSGNSVG